MKRAWSWLLLALPLVMLLPYLDQFAFPIHSTFTDMAISHYPNAVFLRRSILEFGQIPLWSGAILSGTPFFANPLSGLWYPPGWLALLFPLPMGLNLNAALHLVFGGVGMARLLRAEGLGLPASLLAGLAFELLPRGLAHFAAGHLTLIYALAWTPWLLAAARSAVYPISERPMPWEGVLLALILLADVRWAVYAVLIWAGYRMTLLSQQPLRGLLQLVVSMTGQILLAIFLAAPLLIPLGEYTMLSTRQTLTAADNLYLSLPPVRLLGLLAPAFDGNTEWTVYAGTVLLLTVLWVVCLPDLRRKTGFWVALVGLSLLAALGAYLPGASVLAGLPGFNLLRVPARALLPAGMGMAVLLGYCAEHLGGLAGVGLRQAYWSRLTVAGVTGLSLLLAVGSWVVTGSPQPGFLWGAGFALVVVALLFARDRQLITGRVWMVGLSALLICDLAGVAIQIISFHPAKTARAGGEEVAANLAAKEEGPFRIYSPSYSVPQQTAADYGLELADGVDPLQLSVYAAYMEKASGVLSKGYSVTIPPFNDDPSFGNAGHTQDAGLLGDLNVRYLVADFELDSPGLVLEKQIGNTRIYHNKRARPRAWVDTGVSIQPVDSLSLTPNRVQVQASGPGTLVLAELVYPGWLVEVDGRRAEPADPVNGLLRAVDLPAGRHRVSYLFKPASLYFGLGFCALALLGLLLWRVKR